MDRRTRPLAALLLASMFLAPIAADAEMCAGEYQTGARRMTKAQRAREQALMEAARARAEEFEREHRMAEEAARRAEEERLAARPPGVRLVELRCGPCHDAEFIASTRHARPGWWATLLRMELFNSARFETGERGVIVAHLAASQPAGPAQTTLEWGLPALAIALPLAGWLGLRRARGGPGRPHA